MTHIVGKIEGLPLGWPKGTAVMLGNFDGLHRGHQKLIETLRVMARQWGLQTVVFSFSPHPKSFFLNETFHRIYTSEEKAYILEGLGVDVLVDYDFDGDFAAYSPEAFVDVVLAGKLNCRAVVVGEGYRFGRGQSGNSGLLRELGAARGMEVAVVPHVRSDGMKVSSSVIREYIRNARFKDAQALLTRPYFIRSPVLPGRKIGRLIGFPTINQRVAADKLLPPDGVFMTETRFGGNSYRSMTNIGFNPTVGGLDGRSVETFLVDFGGDLYGQTVEVDFREFWRGEMKFDSLESLKEQIGRDVAAWNRKGEC